MPGISTTDRGIHRGARSRGRGFHPPRYNGYQQGRFRYNTGPARSVSPHPYGPPAGKRHWGVPEHREQGPKRHPCLLLITPPTDHSGPGHSGHMHPPQHYWITSGFKWLFDINMEWEFQEIVTCSSLLDSFANYFQCMLMGRNREKSRFQPHWINSYGNFC